MVSLVIDCRLARSLSLSFSVSFYLFIRYIVRISLLMYIVHRRFRFTLWKSLLLFVLGPWSSRKKITNLYRIFATFLLFNNLKRALEGDIACTCMYGVGGRMREDSGTHPIN